MSSIKANPSAAMEMYDVQGVCDIIGKHAFDIVVLQFPDENLADATNVYMSIKRGIAPEVELYITADSTYGSSVDDVSALHVHCKLLVYFGSDMSVSGSMPVVVCPKRIPLDVPHCIDAIEVEIAAAVAAQSEEGPLSLAVFLEPAYFYCLELVRDMIEQRIASDRVLVTVGLRPGCANLSLWEPTGPPRGESVSGYELIGGMLVERGHTTTSRDLVAIIGDKNDQIINICLRYSNSKIICYSPSSDSCSSRLGVDLKEYRERFLGVTRVESAAVIGLIVGSMGLSGDIIQSTVNGLQQLIQAAGKKSYVLVMGRLNEAKLRNFPEIDLFCLVSNDDTSLISPKTFHIPVITPYELELGLGAREWNSAYVVGGFVGSADTGAASGEAFSLMLERVKLNRPEDAIDLSDEDEVEVNAASLKSKICKSEGMSSALTNTNSERRITNQFVSPGADFLKTREFQGMDYAAPVGHSLDAVPGMAGIASGYRHIATVLPSKPFQEEENN